MVTRTQEARPGHSRPRQALENLKSGGQDEGLYPSRTRETPHKNWSMNKIHAIKLSLKYE